MKALMILALSLGIPLVPARGADDELPDTETFHVSAGARNKPLLMKVFAAVQKLEAEKHAGGSRTLEVRQRMSSTSFVVNAGGSSDYWLIPLEPQDWRNRDRIRIDAEFTGDSKTFRDESGRNVTFRVMKQVPSRPVPALTREEFVRRLKEGEKWTLVHFELRPCPKCGGDGMIENPEEYVECRDCHEGRLSIDYIVEW